MRCHYEVLDVSRTANADELKKALELHPDKNIDDPEKATRLFTQVQAAYEVLSDDHERAWYDSHREAILRGEDPSAISGASETATGETPVGVTSTESLMKYFSSTCYSDTDAKGFFSVYSNLFNQLAREEEEACMNETDADAVNYQDDATSLGSPSDSFTISVAHFYAYWSSFSTIKSFRWYDKYNLSTAADRYTRRQMEKGNKKAREGPRREFNETVRNLAAFVKKRDPRFKVYQAEQDALQELKKADLKRKMEAERVERLAALETFEEQDWTKVDDAGVDLHWEEEEVFECIVCEKVFKNQKQLTNHEKSKKHLEALEALKLEFSLEEDDIELTESEPESDIVADDSVKPGQEESLDQVVTALEQTEINPVPSQPLAPEKKKKRINKDSKKDSTSKEESWTCNVCSTVFDTRNKLFGHIRETGHALADGQADNGTTRGKKGKSKRK